MFFSAFKSNITYYPVFKEQSLRVDLSKLNKVSTSQMYKVFRIIDSHKTDYLHNTLSS